jgi:hypothetical protein
MLDGSTLKWFVRGFGLTMLVVLAVVAVIQPPLGRAEQGQGNLLFGRPAGPQREEGAPGADDSTWMAVPLADDSAPVSNLEAGRSGSGTTMLSSEEAAELEARIRLQSSVLVIPAADFRDDGLFPSTHKFEFFGGYQRGTDAHYGCMMAPAYLPNGVQLTELYASVYDNDPDWFTWVNLWRVDNLTGAVDVMAAASTDGMDPNQGIIVISDMSIGFPTISYPAYSYYVTTCAPSTDIRLYSVRLYFDGP